jgi:PPM family protein phosphatase
MSSPEPVSTPPTVASLVRWSALTHRGKIRPNNEDSFRALAFDGREIRVLGKVGELSLAEQDVLFAVSDGMGGAAAGEYASRRAIEHLATLLPRSFRLAAAGFGSGFADVLQELFEKIHHDLTQMSRAYEECAGMGATLSIGWLRPEWFYFGHIGDSRIYYLPTAGGINQVTHDHSHVGWLRRSGKINEREARTHPGRCSLQQSLGAGNQFIDPQIGAIGHRTGDRFLLCSDGLIDGLWDRQLDEICREPAPLTPDGSVAARLIGESLGASGRDNLTAVALEITPAVEAGPTSA